MPRILTNADLKSLVRARSETGALRAHKKTSLTAASLAVAFSHLDRATRLAANLPEGAPCGHVNLRPLARVLVDLAGRSGHADDELSYASQARSAVRNMLAEADLLKKSGEPRTRSDDVGPKWHTLYTAVKGVSRQYAHRLRLVHDLAVAGGVDDPAHLTLRMLRGQAERIGKRARLSSWLVGYRAAREAANRLDLPTLEAEHDPRRRDVWTLDLDAILLTRPAADQVKLSGEAEALLSDAQLKTLSLIMRLNASVATAVVQRLEQGARARYSPAWADKLVGMASRFVAALYATAPVHRLDPATTTFFRAFTTRVEVEGEDNPALRAELGDGYTSTEHRSVMRVILDYWAAPSYRTSNRRLRSEAAADDPVPTYTAAVGLDVDYAFYTVDALLRADLSVRSPEMWDRFLEERRNLQAHIARVRDQRPQEHGRDREQLLDWLSLPQYVCLGLPRLRRVALEARNSYALAAASPATASQEKAKAKYRRALLAYLVPAVCIDGLRISNYCGARMNVHVFLDTVERVVGGVRSVRITEARTLFRGDDPDPLAALKKDEAEAGGANERDWDLLPGIVDYELLADWVFDHRLDVLVALRYLASREEYDHRTDTYGLFIHAGSTDPWGRYTEGRLAERFGRAVYEMIVSPDVMGRPGVPAWRGDEFRRRCAGLFGGHGGRYLQASYWVRVAQDIEYAKKVTNDVERTLKRHYAHLPDSFERRRHVPGTDNPWHFLNVMHAIRARTLIDWDRFDPANPDASLSVATVPQGKRAA